MTGTAPERRTPVPARDLAEIVVPPPIPADAGRVVLIGPPGPLRSQVAQQLRARTALLACLDVPGHLAPILSATAGSRGGLAGATVAFLTVPRVPGPAGGLRHRYRAAALTGGFEQAAVIARHRGAARVIVLSTVFRYDGDQGRSLSPASPVLAAAETETAAAAERAAALFTRLSGDAVILRLGWACSREDRITSRVLAAARRGWRLIDGDPRAWLAMIAPSDAARAVLPALTVPPGTTALKFLGFAVLLSGFRLGAAVWSRCGIGAVKAGKIERSPW